MSNLDESSRSESADGHTNSSTTTTRNGNHQTLDELLQRCITLTTELEEFKEHLKSKRLEHTIEIAHFRNTVKSELRTLQKLSNASIDDQTKEVSQHTVNSSNLPFLETVWNAVKNTTGLQALQKRFYWHDPKPQPSSNGSATDKPLDKRKQSALVDIVTQDGLEWIKVSLITNTRLLFDKAKQGWEDEHDSSSEEEEEDSSPSPSDHSTPDSPSGDTQIPLIRMTHDLLRAAQTVKIRTKHPRITLVLPKITLGQTPAIDSLISSLRAQNITIQTSSSSCCTSPPQPLSAVLPALIPSPFTALTPTLNIDCTILLALVSDFSHCAVSAEPWFHRALKRQVELEDKENLLPKLLYPAMEARRLVCTAAAARRMREIVATIGTVGEKVRTALFMGDEEGSPTTAADGDDGGEAEKVRSAELRDRLQEWTRFEVPSQLLLPIRTVDPEQVDKADWMGLPPAAEKVRAQLTEINNSVFLFGWASGWSTITSNRTVVKQIERLLDENAEDEADWPSIWLCPTARSLVGKEKGRRG